MDPQLEFILENLFFSHDQNRVITEWVPLAQLETKDNPVIVHL